MTIKKFQGRTEEEATAKAWEELGAQTVIMNVKEVKPKGVMRFFKSPTYEVTAAVEEAEPAAPSKPGVSVAAPGNINLAADEQIPIPKPEPLKEVFATVENTWASASAREAQEKTARSASASARELPEDALGGRPVSAREAKERTGERRREAAVENHLEERLESLQSLLEEKLAPQPGSKADLPKEGPMDDNFKFMKMIYGILLENEVEEKYVNQIMDEVEKVMKGGASLDLILSSIYQKMILKFGQPQPIELSESKPKVVFFIGPTGVGKTTTIAKIASQFKLDRGKKVVLFTADTYRIAAVEQLRTYANILDTDISIIYSSKEMNEQLREAGDCDLVLVDTAGFSHKNQEQLMDTRDLVNQVPEEYEKETCLVLSATTKYKDLIDIADVYKENFQFKMIFTKMDETSCYGNILNMKMYTGADLSYSTYGQNVPEDIEIFNTQKIVKLLLGGK
ncbi:MAG: flagellar biosynthesis protein FlhF [Lachnospiraceae bacterium]|jgi:flagellar biosynthesis protein FlhF|nr:flagellar biosynthesis protein FlhF [Lachnospiraceae bacterium]